MGREADSGRFRVYVDDNYHHMDESERYLAGEFEDVEQAVARCRDIVDECLASAYQPGMSAAELLRGYKMLGEDPWVSAPPGRECQFSAWVYAEQRCAELCKAPETKERP